MTHEHGKRKNLMNYKARDEEELIRQIESDPELDKELEREKLVKGHVVEIRYTGKAHKKAGAAKKKSAASQA
ncbi:MAG: hypothetical protein KKD46_03275 [Euryarchaeota archaeon]|nr:hypothetical protein [Euryarchaeota archaeon]MBU4339923.1 hypothetical protein [Euryarchaeota archaeon]MCG2737425.1 hypothetical protein [Candidatus Methanoperedenaceae archaeon]